jgi:hypothetical protein
MHCTTSEPGSSVAGAADHAVLADLGAVRGRDDDRDTVRLNV